MSRKKSSMSGKEFPIASSSYSTNLIRHKPIPVSSGSIDDFADDNLGAARGLVNTAKLSMKYGPLALLLTGSVASGVQGYGMPSCLLGFYASVFYAGFFCNPELNFSNQPEQNVLDHKKHGFSEAQYASAQEIFRKSI